MTKLLIFSDFYYPGYKAGGPIQSIYNLSSKLTDQCELFIVTRDRDTGDTSSYNSINPNKWNDFSSYKVFYLNPDKINHRFIGEIIEEINPDIVYLNSFFSSFSISAILYSLFYNRRLKILMAPRGEFNSAALQIKKKKKKVYLVIFNLILKKFLNISWQATNDQEFSLIKGIIGENTKTYLLENTGKATQLPLKQISKEIGELRILTIARVHPIKNLLFFAEIISELCIKNDIKIWWDVCGLIEKKDYAEQIKNKLANCRNLIFKFKGDIPNDQIPTLCMDYHLFVLPTLGENFGHAIYDAILSGLPLLISNNTPWRKLEEHQIGFDLPLDPQMWKKKLLYFLGLNYSEISLLKQNTYAFGRRKIDCDKSGSQFISIMNKIS